MNRVTVEYDASFVQVLQDSYGNYQPGISAFGVSGYEIGRLTVLTTDGGDGYGSGGTTYFGGSGGGSGGGEWFGTDGFAFSTLANPVSAEKGVLNFYFFLPQNTTPGPYLDEDHIDVAAINFEYNEGVDPLLVAPQYRVFANTTGFPSVNIGRDFFRGIDPDDNEYIVEPEDIAESRADGSIPEPAALGALAVAGLMALRLARRRREDSASVALSNC